MTMRKWLITAALLAAAATGSLAQDQQQGQHMPMGQGMGMMGGCPMMRGNMGMSMMGQGMQGMMGPGMMGNMPMGMGSMGQGMGPGMMMGQGPMMEGRLAYLKAELGITDTQAAAWDGYVSAVKARGDTMQSMHATMMQAMQSGTAIARMDAHTKHMEAMLDAMKALKPATEALYKVLGDDQKKKADMLLGMGCCMM
ncbi:MAG: hypothetical protein C0519_15685 [Hyphomicrobium sp.]|jgi:hypothetical protein|nr:hypothetical protein [Hyphomicrobium sp.]MBY0225211.1 Spy/CpxP family protein refolding chaperone [Hyphomicrobium sp.]